MIGCGDIGLANARAVAAAANAEVVLCHDAAPALAEAAAAAVGAGAAPSLAAALDPGRVDAAFLSVPHDLHAPLVARCAEAGLHVVVEKPLAGDLAAAREAVAAAAAAGVALSTCFSYRYYEAVRAARALAEAGALGAFTGATVAFHADKPASYWVGGFSGRAASDWRASRERAGGGVLIMNLTHYVDLIRHLTGAEPEWVAGTARTAPGEEVEDAIALSVGFSGGAVATISGSSSTRGAPPNRVELWGEDGTVRLEPTAEAYTERAVGGLTPGRWTPLPVEAVDRTRRAFVERVRGGDRDRRGARRHAGRRAGGAGLRRRRVPGGRERGGRRRGAGRAMSGIDAVLAALGTDAAEVVGAGPLADALRDRLAAPAAPPAAIVDTTGDPAAIADALARVDDLGTVVLAGPGAGGAGRARPLRRRARARADGGRRRAGRRRRGAGGRRAGPDAGR